MSIPIPAALAAVLMSAVPPLCLAQTAAVPAAPQVTVGAGGLKVLQFDWLPVPGATHYLLEYQPNASAPFAPHGNAIVAPRVRAALTIPVHAFDWANARYRVSACNAAGCLPSAALPVQSLMLTSIGYVKASNPDAFDGFGRYAQLSQDGNTLVVAAHEDSYATGVNADESDNSSEDSGAVYVYRRVGAGWRQEAYLKPSVNHPQQYFGIGYPLGFRALSVSANGSLIAVGAPGEQTGPVQFAGAVYLFARELDGTWHRSAKLTLPEPRLYDYFGHSVDLSSDGAFLKVSASDPRDAVNRPKAFGYIYHFGEFGWVQYGQIGEDDHDISCSIVMSGDAESIISLCDNEETGPHLRTRRRLGAWQRVQDIPLPSYQLQAPALSGNSARMAFWVVSAAGVREVHVFGWNGAAWVREAVLESPAGASPDFPGWGQELALNRNGTVLAVGDYTHSTGGAGVSEGTRPPNAPPPLNREGAVFVFQRGSATGAPAWTLKKVVKAPNPANGDSFGRDVSLSGNGLTFAVGAPGEDSAARGIDGNQANNSRESAGAVYLY